MCVFLGILGDCWLLSTCAALAKKEELLHRVLPPDQDLFGPNYNGSIRLKIWQFGVWHDVIIDDKLPLLNGKYIYGHCADPTEFWVALIEKAFAKVKKKIRISRKIKSVGKFEISTLCFFKGSRIIRKSGRWNAN